MKRWCLWLLPLATAVAAVDGRDGDAATGKEPVTLQGQTQYV